MAVHTGPGVPPVLSGADVNVHVETFLQDPSQIFMLVTAKWPSVTVPTSQVPEPLRSQISGNVLQLNLEGEPPSKRLSQVYDFVMKDLISFLQTSTED
jgi:hypothetical protein